MLYLKDLSVCHALWSHGVYKESAPKCDVMIQENMGSILSLSRLHRGLETVLASL
jgi:hypothetical protein